MNTLLGVTDGDGDPDAPACTCQTDPHRGTCMTVAWTQPHAMVTDRGDVYYPTNAGDAYEFARYYSARPLRPDVFPFAPKAGP